MILLFVKVKQFLKYDKHVPLKMTEMVLSAEQYIYINVKSFREAVYFSNVGKLVGGLASAAFFFFPVIRYIYEDI